jgi:DNA-binding NarL/FixJ family response regulator
MSLRVVVGEDAYVVRVGITQVLAVLPDVELAAECDRADDVLRAVADTGADVVLVDIRMPPGQTDEGIQVAETLRETHPDVGVLVLSQYLEPEYVLRLFATGSERRGYLLKERVGAPDELGRAIRAVAAGGSVVDPKVVEALVAERTRAERSRLRRLTTREHEVLALVASGRSNAAIAEELFLTKRAVEKHINAIFGKLDLPDETVGSRRVHATLLYLADAESAGAPHRS